MSIPSLVVDPHPVLRHGAFVSRWSRPLGDIASPLSLLALLAEGADAPLAREEDVRQAVRDLLRHGGYKPTGRGKPASEYLAKAAAADKLGSINPAVDCCNAASLHSGLPISVVDLDCIAAPLRIGLAEEGERYVFNASGQEIDLAGLLCLFDASGPCANAVKDSQRTKTSASTFATLSVVWGCLGHEGRLARALAWYRELVESTGGATEPVVEP